MDENDFVDMLNDLLHDRIDEYEGEFMEDPTYVIKEIETFGEGDIISMDAGLVVRMQDGCEFQIKVKRSR